MVQVLYQRDQTKRIYRALCPLGIRIIACSGLGSGYVGHAPQASILVRSGEGSGNVFGVCGAEQIPVGSVQENLQVIVPARGILILFCHAEVHPKHLGETQNQNQKNHRLH